MSDINLDFSISNNVIAFTVQPNDITFTPTDIQLSYFGGGLGIPGGSTGQLQYNNGGLLGGVANTSFNGANLSLGNISNIKISGGSNNFALITDGAGNLSWGSVANANVANYANYANYAGNAFSVNAANIVGIVANANYAAYAGNAFSVAAANIVGTIANANYAAYAGNVTIAGQSNITSLGTLTALNVNGTSNLSNVGNVKITGGINGQYLQTDGTGNLTFATGGGSGNGVVGGANTQIQYNNNGNFGGNAGFTFNNTTSVVAMPGNLNVVSTITSNGFTGPIISLPYGTENVSLIAAQTGTYNFDFISNGIRYTTSNASANLTLNFRGNSTVTANTILANGQSITGTYVFKTGTTPYGVTAVQVDSVSQTIKWTANTIPLKVANTLTSYVFTIVKTSTTPTYDILASATRYG
jgi:hypothetical protein